MLVLFEFLVKVILVGLIVIAVAVVAAIAWALVVGFVKSIKGKGKSE